MAKNTNSQIEECLPTCAIRAANELKNVKSCLSVMYTFDDRDASLLNSKKLSEISTMHEIQLAKGFITTGEREIAEKGLAIPNNKWRPNRDWPQGILFGLWYDESKMIAEKYAMELAREEPCLTPAVGFIKILPQTMFDLRGEILGIKRQYGDEPSSSVNVTGDHLYEFHSLSHYKEVLIPEEYMKPNWLSRLNATIGIGDQEGNFTYQPFKDLRANVEGQPFWTRIFRK